MPTTESYIPPDGALASRNPDAHVHFSNIRMVPGVEYFFYIGELKNYGLNYFLREALSRYYGHPFDFISIVPDVFEQYDYDNIAVINPWAADIRKSRSCNFSCRVPPRRFMSHVSANPGVRELVDRLLASQGRLFIYMYESIPEMTLDAIDGVTVLGPDSRIASRMNSKIYQFSHLKDVVPLVDFRICPTMDKLLHVTRGLWSGWTDGIVVSCEYSAAGICSMVAHDEAQIQKRFTPSDAPFLVSRYMPHTHDPTVLAVVAGPSDCYIAGVADQRIENGTRFTGSTFPSRLSGSLQRKLRRHTRDVGLWLAGQGYRGIYGCDFIVTAEERIFFLEVNARKQGTTMEFCCTLQHNLPPESPSLPELEFHAVMHGRFPQNTVEATDNPARIHWGTYNYKMDRETATRGYLPRGGSEREAFRKVADNSIDKDFLILEHIGNGFVVAEGSFLGRIVALGHDHESVAQGLQAGRRTLDLTISRIS